MEVTQVHEKQSQKQESERKIEMQMIHQYRALT